MGTVFWLRASENPIQNNYWRSKCGNNVKIGICMERITYMDANCSTVWLKLWSAWCKLFRRLIEVVIRMMPIVPQVYWSCDSHDANCSAGWLKLWSAWCQLFRRLIEVVIRMMPIVPQVNCRCGPHDANCSAGLLQLWSAWCQVFLQVYCSYFKFKPIFFKSVNPPGRLDFALGGLRNSLKSSDYIKFDLNCHFLYFSVKKYLFLKKNNFTKILIAILIFKLLPFRFLQCIVHVFEHLFHAFKRFCYA